MQVSTLRLRFDHGDALGILLVILPLKGHLDKSICSLPVCQLYILKESSYLRFEVPYFDYGFDYDVPS